MFAFTSFMSSIFTILFTTFHPCHPMAHHQRLLKAQPSPCRTLRRAHTKGWKVEPSAKRGARRARNILYGDQFLWYYVSGSSLFTKINHHQFHHQIRWLWRRLAEGESCRGSSTSKEVACAPQTWRCLDNSCIGPFSLLNNKVQKHHS